jgi:FkbM family methyltransferase
MSMRENLTLPIRFFMLKIFLIRLFRLYFCYFPIRKGKFPVLVWLTKKELAKDLIQSARFDKNIIIEAHLDDWIQKQIYFFGRYEIEKEQTKFWNNFIQPGMIVLDIGANIGYYSLMAAKRTGKTGKVYAFEPVNNTFRLLVENIRINGFTNISAHKIAFSDTSGKTEIFTADSKNTGMSSFSEHVHFSGIKESVDMIEGDAFIASLNPLKIDLVKIDVEGAELKVLKGMIQSIIKFRPLILMEINELLLRNNKTSPAEIYLAFQNIGYSPYEFTHAGSLIPVEGFKESNLIAFMYSNNN